MNKIKLYWSLFSEYLYLAGLGILVFLLVGLFFSIPLCLLWNWLMPYIFGLPTLNILQTFGLTIIITLLSPKEIKLSKGKPKTITDTKMDIDGKLEEVLKDITSQFKA